MKKLLFLLMIIVALLAGNQSYAQKGVAINNTGADPDNSAILDVSSLTKGVLIPRMTAVQRTAIVTPVKGLLVYQNDGTEGFYYFDGAAWTSLASGTYTETDPLVKAINGVVKSNGTTISAAVAGTDYLTPAGNESMTNKTINGLIPIAAATGFTIAGGTTSKTLTVPLDASVSGINTGDNATNTQYSGLEAAKANVSGAAFTGDISATNLSGSSPSSKAILDLSSTTKGFLPPRMTFLEKSAITSPPAGLMVWCTNCGTYGELQVSNGIVWTNLIGGAALGSTPGAPTIGTATAEDGQASVSFTAPASDGGSAITLYTATSSPDGKTETLAQAGSGTITVTGLTNGAAYTFTVTATNANGTSAASDPSNSVTPASVPGAPTGVSATPGNGQASVSFTAPASNGGSAITLYTATSTTGGKTGTVSGPGSGTITVTGLTNGTAYTFTVTATNAIGIGAASDPSNTVTPATVPGAPSIGTATAGATQASVSFTAPASNGGSPITSYTATSNPGNFTGTLTQAGSGTITVSGLTMGTTYTFTVTATNAMGMGAASAASNSVKPALAIGQSYGGGIIAYIYQPSDNYAPYKPGETHGIIAANEDQSTGIVWAKPDYVHTWVVGQLYREVGRGSAATNLIIAQNGAGTTYAAGLARAYTGGGFNDWYLPSVEELLKLVELKNLGFGNFAIDTYWSSSEYNQDSPCCVYFNYTYFNYYWKDYPFRVRAVRSF